MRIFIFTNSAFIMRQSPNTHFYASCCIFVLLLVFGASPTLLNGQKETIFDQWMYDDYLEITLETDLSIFTDGSRFDQGYQDADFIYENADGEEEVFDMKIRMRGKFRRKNCTFPPLKLNFDKDDMEARGWYNDDEYKLVTPCVSGPVGREYVLKEYLAYKIYQELSDIHFRVQLVKFTIADRESNKKHKGWGFIIEDGKTLERRYNVNRCSDCYSLSSNQFNQENLRTTALFQYLVGNADWSVTLNKNIEILQSEADSSQFFVVPYDFDYSGFVNPTYAAPNSDYNLKSVRERVFLSDLSDQDMQPAINKFLEEKQDIMALIKNFKRLNYTARQDVMGYIESFYDSLAEAGLQRPEDKVKKE